MFNFLAKFTVIIEIVKFSHVNRVVYMIKLYSKKYLVTFEMLKKTKL